VYVILISSHRLIHGAGVGQHLVTAANKFFRVGLTNRGSIRLPSGLKVNGLDILYTAAYKEIRTAAVYESKWLTGRH